MLNIIDYRGNEYPVMVMSLTYAINQNETISGVAVSEEEKENSGTDLLTRIISKTTNAAQQIISTYDKILTNMTELISQGFGMYTSREQLSDGSYINYMHNKPTIGESSVIWKLTSNGLMVSRMDVLHGLLIVMAMLCLMLSQHMVLILTGLMWIILIR